MTATLATTPPGNDLLGELVARRADEDQAARDVLMLAVRYAAQHPAPGVTEEEAVYGDQPLELAGPGAPGVSEFAVAEFAAALGMTPASGRRFLGAALEVAHRLPSIWARVQAGTVPAWRARMVADKTVNLSQEGALYVDQKVAPRADRIGPITLAKLVDEARLLSEEPEEDRTLDLRTWRRAQIDTRGMAEHGIAYVDAALDIADALDLEKALQVAATELKGTHDDLTLDQRRSIALGEIARTYLAGHDTGTTDGNGIQLYVHYTPDSDLGRRDRARLENTHGLTTLDQISEWLARPGVTVRLTPVIDLAETLRSTGYTPSPRLREQVILRDGCCAFPNCSKSARTGDLDHIEPYDPTGPPGQTNSSNLASLCRSHHRLKTHGGWTYRILEPGYYLWQSPTGRRYLRTPAGTVTLA